jgi:hypothetical protein
MAVYCFTQLIQPGKREEAKAIFEEIRGPRRSEYEASRRRLGIREEKVWFQGLPRRGRWPWSIGKGRPPAGRCKSSHALRIPSTSG